MSRYRSFTTHKKHTTDKETHTKNLTRPCQVGSWNLFIKVIGFLIELSFKGRFADCKNSTPAEKKHPNVFTRFAGRLGSINASDFRLFWNHITSSRWLSSPPSKNDMQIFHPKKINPKKIPQHLAPPKSFILKFFQIEIRFTFLAPQQNTTNSTSQPAEKPRSRSWTSLASCKPGGESQNLCVRKLAAATCEHLQKGEIFMKSRSIYPLPQPPLLFL